MEFARFQFHDGKKFTNTFFYVALVVTGRSSLPSFVVLGEASKLETTPVAEYRTSVGRTRGVVLAKEPTKAAESGGGGSSAAAYSVFWKPLEPALAGAKRVYVAPDGVLNQIPLSLFADESGQLLLEKYDLRPVNSTKDLLRPSRPASSKSAVLLGNPKFAMTEQEQRAALEKLTAGEPKQPGA